MLAGPLYLGKDVTNVNSNVTPTGGTDQTGAGNTLLDNAYSDALSASTTLSGMTADQTFASLDSAQTITATHAGLNVIDAGEIKETNGILTFNSGGFSNVQFAVNDTGGFSFSNSQFLAGAGVSPDSLLFNVTGGDASVTGGGGTVLDGIILDTGGSIAFHDKTLTGALIGNNISITSGGTVNGPSPVPEASTTVSFGLLLALGLGGVAAARKKAGASAL